MVSTVRERDFSRNLGEEEGTVFERVSTWSCSAERGVVYHRAMLGGGWRRLTLCI